MTKTDKKGRNVLHLAAQFGDKNFCTMLLYEADDLKFGKEIIDVYDKHSLTPLYLLCEEGFRKSQNFNEEEEILYYEIVERQKIEKRKGKSF